MIWFSVISTKVYLPGYFNRAVRIQFFALESKFLRKKYRFYINLVIKSWKIKTTAKILNLWPNLTLIYGQTKFLTGFIDTKPSVEGFEAKSFNIYNYRKLPIKRPPCFQRLCQEIAVLNSLTTLASEFQKEYFSDF